MEHKHDRLRARSALRKLQGAMRSQCYNSRNSAHLCVYHTSLRPSSNLEPRHPPLPVTFKGTVETGARCEADSKVVEAKITLRKVVRDDFSASNCRQCIYGIGVSQCANDPSAGSPTETLLRLLLPLSGKVYTTYHCKSRDPFIASI